MIISWKDYIKSNILEFRKRYDKFSERQKSLVEHDEFGSLLSLNMPCQVGVIDFRVAKCLIFLHSREKPDMEIEVLEEAVMTDFSLEMLKNIGVLETFDSKMIGKINRIIVMASLLEDDISWTTFEKKAAVFWFKNDPRTLGQYFVSDSILQRIELVIDTLEIGMTVDDIKRDAKGIAEGALRTKIVEATRRLERQMAPLQEAYKELQSEIVGIRRLVGTKSYGEWKVLVSEIDKINARIDSLSEIREAYDKVLAQQTKVIEQQSSFVKWIKYATILLPIAVVSVPVIEIVSILIRRFLGVP